MKEERLLHVLLLYRKMIPSIRLCGHCQMEYLAQMGKIEYRAVQEFSIKSSDLNWADIIVLGRLDSWYEYQLAKEVHEADKYLMYIIDDDLLNVPPQISSAGYYGQKEIHQYISSMLAMSDAILSPSPILLEKYAVDGKRAVQIEEPALETLPYRVHDPSQPVKIGFAGSIDRVGDIETILKDALLKVKRTYGKRVQFEFFGAVPSFAEEMGARCIPYCDSYDTYRKTLSRLAWDIGLAPMPETPFHACKHYNKFVEYGAAGVIGIYSDTEPYTRLRVKGLPAILCKNTPEEWYKEVCRLIEETDERERLRQACIQKMINDFKVERCLGELPEIIAEAPIRDQKRRIWSIFLIQKKIIGRYKRIVDKLKRIFMNG